MKILMTGTSARSVGSTKIRYDYVALSDIFERALRDLGHEVDRRPVSTDESDTLDEYDRALVLVNWVSSLSSMHDHEAGLALDRLGDRAILYVDDWRTQSLADDIDHHVLRDVGWDNHVFRFRKKEYAALTFGQTERIRAAYLSLIDETYPVRPMIGPFHPWGDPSKHLEVSKVPLNVRLLPIDPSPMVHIPFETFLKFRRFRRRQWVLATLQNHDRWLKKLDLGWPLVQYGGVKKGGGGIRAGGPDRVVPERDVVQAYADNGGMLVAPYANEGSGWWRPRYTFALETNTPIYVGSRVDAELIGPSFTNEVADIEAATDDELDALAARQAAQWRSHEGGPEDFLDLLQEYVTR